MELQNKTPLAVESHTTLNLPFRHASTQSFMLLQPMYYKHCLRTEHERFLVTSKVIPQPIVVPTFGRISHNLRHFFVPYRLIMPNWDEALLDTIASNQTLSSQVIEFPQIYPDAILNLFIKPSNQFTTIVTDNSEDFIAPDSTKYRFTRMGKQIYKILYSLGYDIVGGDKRPFFNALALLAYAKVYCDWYANSQYLNNALYLKLQQYFKYNDPSTPLVLMDTDLYYIFMFIRPCVYKQNTYFEDAWDNPVSPNSSNFTNFLFTDPTTSNGSRILTNMNGTPEMFQTNNTDLSLGTDYLHTALKKLSVYQHRHALAGARSIDRLLAEYGVKTDYQRLNRSVYIGCNMADVEINQIFATANGSNSMGSSVVGDYSGTGHCSANHSFDFVNDEEGIIITISTIIPQGGYYQGYDRHNRHLSKTQFFNADFDALGVQSIEKGEVYVSKDMSSFISSAQDYAGHFGFTGRYGEYKRSIDRVSGDLALPKHLAGGKCWHLMRTFDDAYFNNSIANVSHDEDFARGTDAGQYNRIFTYTEEYAEIDPFQVFVDVQCSSIAPCKPLTDEFEWDSLAPKVSISSNGSKLN